MNGIKQQGSKKTLLPIEEKRLEKKRVIIKMITAVLSTNLLLYITLINNQEQTKKCLRGAKEKNATLHKGYSSVILNLEIVSYMGTSLPSTPISLYDRSGGTIIQRAYLHKKTVPIEDGKVKYVVEIPTNQVKLLKGREDITYYAYPINTIEIKNHKRSNYEILF